jgi:hypothetical protein
MARVKRVLFVRATEHDRLMAALRAEKERYKMLAEVSTRALCFLGADVDAMMLQVESIMAAARRALQSRNHLRRHINVALVACGASGCTRLLYRSASNIGGRSRRCDACAEQERAAFHAARAAIEAARTPDAQEATLDLDTPAASPSAFLARDDDDADASTQSI